MIFARGSNNNEWFLGEDIKFMEFSQTERKISHLLSYFPLFKRIAKKCFQGINYVIHRPAQKCILHPRVSIKRIGTAGKGSFFGYYNHSPDFDGQVLYHQFEKKRVKKRNTGYIDICVNNEKISETNSWNWQQGCMATWIGKNRIAHNYYENGYKCKIIDIKKKQSLKVNFPFYCFFPDGESFLSLNFVRLAKLRPDYGYFNENFKNIPKFDSQDGIVKVNIHTQEKKTILSFQTLLSLNSKKTMKNAWHKVNHIDINPDGNRFMFLHRWYSPGGIKYSRLITADKNGHDLYVLSDDDMVSHCCWIDNQGILGWLRKKESGDKYYFLKDKMNEFTFIDERILGQDGHPGISNNKQWILTDTYPNKSRMSRILLYNIKKQTIITIGEFLSSLKYSDEYRCDLHPRFSQDNKTIFLDSVHEGTRYLYQIDISKLIL